jgi:hypothetical protein
MKTFRVSPKLYGQTRVKRLRSHFTQHKAGDASGQHGQMNPVRFFLAVVEAASQNPVRFLLPLISKAFVLAQAVGVMALLGNERRCVASAFIDRAPSMFSHRQPGSPFPSPTPCSMPLSTPCPLRTVRMVSSNIHHCGKRFPGASGTRSWPAASGSDPVRKKGFMSVRHGGDGSSPARAAQRQSGDKASRSRHRLGRPPPGKGSMEGTSPRHPPCPPGRP